MLIAIWLVVERHDVLAETQFTLVHLVFVFFILEHAFLHNYTSGKFQPSFFIAVAVPLREGEYDSRPTRSNAKASSLLLTKNGKHE